MAETLYRKYRPQQFGEIHGQVGITKTLTNQLLRNTVAHAYIFSGTRGTGKTSTARVFAKALNCKNRTNDGYEPCNSCVSCTEISIGRSIDVIELDAATHTGVDTVREEIIENSRTNPTRDTYKIFIIDEVHMLSTSSFNALLKSLEEPPSHVVYILATTELHKIPATVASRCQRFIFRPLELLLMEEKLRMIANAEGVTIDPDVIRQILTVSGGAMRDAESLLGQLISLGASDSTTTITASIAHTLLPATLFFEAADFLRTLHLGDRTHALEILQDLFERGTDMPSFHESLIRRAHELLIVCATKQLPLYLGIFSDTESALLQDTALMCTTPVLSNILVQLLEKKSLYKTINSPLIPLHLVVLQTPGEKIVLSASPNIKKLVDPTAVVVTPTIKVLNEPPPTASVQPLIAEPPSDIFVLVQDHWPNIVAEIRGQIPSLAMILSSTIVQNAFGNEIELSVAFPLYREKLLELKTKTKIEQAISTHCGVPLHYKVTQATPTISKTDEVVTDMLESFGGRVVV